MKLKDYQVLADSFNLVPEERVTSHALTGLAEEVGEVMGLYKRALRGDMPKVDKIKLAYEIGDVLWYVSALCSANKIPLERVAKMNLLKLTRRMSKNSICGSGDR